MNNTEKSAQAPKNKPSKKRIKIAFSKWMRETFKGE